MIKKITNYFMKGEKSSKSILNATFLVASLGLASRFLGLIRDRILASKFGAGDTLDVYYAAFKIPDLIFNLLILGALSAAFIPVFTSLISNKKKKEAWSLVNKFISLAGIVLVFVIIVLYFLAPNIIGLIAFGFGQEKQIAVTSLTKIMLFSPLLLGFSSILGGILNSHKKFFFYSLAPVFYNIGIIIGAVFFVEMFGISGLGYGVVLGALLHLLIQIPEVVRCGLKFKPDFKFKDENLKKVLTLMISRTMGLAVVQVNFLIVTILASTLESGSLAIFSLANNIQSVPLGLIGVSFAIVAFPTLSCCWAQNKKKEFVNNFSDVFEKIVFFIIPVSIIFITLRAQLVRIILGSGQFDWHDTILTFQALGIFSLSLFAQTLIPLLTRAFYAIHNTKTPFFIGLFSEGINLALALLLIQKYQIVGLVWAFSIATIVNMFLLLIVLRKKIGNLNEKSIIQKTWKVMSASIAMVIGIQTTKYLVAFVLERFSFNILNYSISMYTLAGILIQTLVSLLAGFILFYLASKLLKIEELDYFINLLRRKIFSFKKLNKFENIESDRLK
jgi:putative peptidoglycan lipid II flippase